MSVEFAEPGLTPERCPICKRSDTDRCHIKSKGSGGTFDDFNIIRMCRQHHSEQHALGWRAFATKYPVIRVILHDKGWTFNEHGKVQRR